MNVLKHGVLYLICFNLCIVRTVEIYNSCQDALERSCGKNNGVYNIKTTTSEGYSEIYCVLEDPSDSTKCPGAGWTPVIYDPASGGIDELTYDSAYWTEKDGLNVDGGRNFHNVTQQTLLPTFWSTKVSEICLENRYAGTHLTFPYSSRTLRATFAGGRTEFTPVVQDWKDLKPNFTTALFPLGTAGYFNYKDGDNRIRLGISVTPTYEVIGIGIRFNDLGTIKGGPGLQHYAESGSVGAKRPYALYVK